jgi:hypothetical protein
MSETITNDTPVAGENVQPVTTDTGIDTEVSAKSEDVVLESAHTSKAAKVEIVGDKMMVDGHRVYQRDDVNKIAASAKKEAEAKLLSDLQLDSFDQVRSVVNQLRNTDTEQGDTLNISQLKDSVKKKEQTVAELQAELSKVKTDFALKQHVSTLKDNMPNSWDTNQKDAVIDLMQARNMLLLEGDTFAIKNGEDYLTVDGETPDYKQAVEVVGKTLGLPFAKKGVATFDADKQPTGTVSNKEVDSGKLKSDPAYRAAYVRLRTQNPSLSTSSITDAQVKAKIRK